MNETYYEKVLWWCGLIFLLFVLIMSFITFGNWQNSSGFLYKVCDSEGGGGDTCEYANEYIEKDNCVIVNSNKFCGTYRILKNK